MEYKNVRFNALFNNCEHFVNKVTRNESISAELLGDLNKMKKITMPLLILELEEKDKRLKSLKKFYNK